MAVNGNDSLHSEATLGIDDVKKKAEEVIKTFQRIKKDGESAMGGKSGVFDSKPMTEYQKKLISLRKDLIDQKKTWQELIEQEKQAQISSAQSKAETDKLKVSEQELTVALKAKKISQEEYNLEQKKNIDAQKLAAATQKEADRQINQSNKLLREQLTIARQQETQREKNRKKLQQESSEYYQLNKALNAVRGRTKDVLAAMFDLERQGKKNSDAYKALEQRSKGMVAQTNILDRGIKKIDATLGLHQRHVGDYGRALEGLSPHFASINAQLAMFGTSLQELSEEGGVKALGASIADVGKNILKFLISPVGLAIAAFTALYALFTGNKDTVIEFDNKLLNVSKTTNMAGRELDQFGNDIINLSRALKTVSTDKLLEYATVAGQLGVKGRDNILAFSEALAKLETASNISGEEGGSEIARLLTLTDGGVQNVKAFGDEIVNLGNNFAATEKEILSNAEQISQNTGLYKIGRQDVLAYATATKAVGLEAEVVGSAFNRTLSTFEKSIRTGKNIDELAKQTGKSVEQLKAQFKENSAGVFNDFLGGLNKVNASGGSVNEVLEKLGIVAVRDQRVISTLATTGYGKLTEAMDTVRNASGALDQEFNTASGKLVNQTKKFGIAWDNLVLSVENGQGVIGKASVGVISFFTDIVGAITPSTRSMIVNEEQVAGLTGKYDELTKKGQLLGGAFKLSKTEQDELRRVTAELGTLMPGIITQFDKYGNALDINRDKISTFTKAQRELLALQNKADIQAANESFNRSKQSRLDAEKGVKDNKKVTFFGFEIRGDKDIAGYADQIKLARGSQNQFALEIKALGGTLTKEQEDIIKYFSEVDKAIESTTGKTEDLGKGIKDGTVRTADAIKAEIKKIQELQKPLDIASDAYAKNAAKIRELKKELAQANGTYKGTGAGAENSAIQRAKSLGQKLTDIHNASLRNQKESDQSELDSVKDKYAKMREEVDKFYADPNNLNRPVIINGKPISKSKVEGQLKADETRDTELANAKQAIEDTKKQIETQKILFDEYEQFKLKAGEKAANERYAIEIKDYKSYVDYLKKQLPEETGTSVLGNKKRDLITKELLPKAENEQLKRQEDEYTALLLSTQDFEDEKLRVEAIYQQQRLQLLNKGKLKNVFELDKQYKEEQDSLIDHYKSRSEIMQRLGERELVLTRSEVKKQIAGLENALKDITIPDNVKSAVEKNLNDLKVRLNIGVDQSNLDILRKRRVDILGAIDLESKKATPSVSGLNAELNELNEQIDDLDPKGAGKVSGLQGFLNGLKDNKTLVGFAKGMALASDAALTLSEGLGGVDTKAGYTLETIGQLAGAAADLGASIATGDPSKIIGSAIKAVGTLFTIGKKVKEINAAARKEVADYYSNAISGEREYQDLLKERAIENVKTNKIALQGIRDEVVLRKSQMDSYKKESDEIMQKIQGQDYISGYGKYKHATWFRKEEKNPIRESLAGKSFADLSQLLAQGKLDGEAKALVERLKELEQKGYDAERALADLAKQTSELFTGTTSDSLTDSLADMFKNGKTSAKDFADFFKTTMDEAALSIFKNKVLAGAIEEFYKEFDKASQSGDELTVDEIARLNGLFTSLTGDALKKFEEFQRITGSDLNPGGTKGSLSSEISEKLTEATGTELSGLMRGQYDLTKQLVVIGTERNNLLLPISKGIGDFLSIARSNLDVAIKNERNTFRIAENTEGMGDKLDKVGSKLDKIVNNTSSQSSRSLLG